MIHKFVLERPPEALHRSVVITVALPAHGSFHINRCSSSGIRTLAGTIILPEKVIKPVLPGVCRKTAGMPPKDMHHIDTKYDALKQDMYTLLHELRLAA